MGSSLALPVSSHRTRLRKNQRRLLFPLRQIPVITNHAICQVESGAWSVEMGVFPATFVYFYNGVP